MTCKIIIPSESSFSSVKRIPHLNLNYDLNKLGNFLNKTTLKITGIIIQAEKIIIATTLES